MLRDYKCLLMKTLQKNSNQNHLQQKTGDRLLNSLYSRTLRQLEVDNYIYTDERDKANVLNSFFSKPDNIR